MVTVARTALCVKLLCDRGQRTPPSTYLPTYHLQNPTTLNHLLYFFAFGKKVLGMEKISELAELIGNRYGSDQSQKMNKLHDMGEFTKD